MSFLNIAAIFLILFSFEANARGNVKKPFKVTVQSFERDVPTHQKMTELKMSQNTDFCRGTMIPYPKGDWSCEGRENQVQECVITYECKMITKERSRISESRRLRADLAKLPKERSKSTMIVSRKPDGNMNRYIIKEITAPKKIGRPSGIVLTKEELDQIRKGAIVILPDPEDEEFEEAVVEADYKARTEQQTPQTRRVVKKLVIEPKKEQVGSRLLDDDGPELIRKNNKEKVSSSFAEKFVWKSISGSLINAKDDFENSQSTLGIAWTPRYKFNDQWAIRGHVGFHSYKVIIEVEEESFMVYELGAYAQYYFENIYLELGGGFHKWNDSVLAETYTVMGAGIGYRFSEPVLKFIDRLSVSMANVSNDAKNSEIRFTLGLSF